MYTPSVQPTVKPVLKATSIERQLANSKSFSENLYTVTYTYIEQRWQSTGFTVIYFTCDLIL